MSTHTLVPSHRQVFALAIPVILANLATPFLGMVDTAVMGRFPGAAHIAAIGLGATVFSLLYWGFSFLRLTTVGLTAQASGANQYSQLYAHLLRPLLVALGIGVAMWLLQAPMGWLLFGLLGGGEEVQNLAKAYYQVRIWSAPFTLANFALSAWFLGQGKAARVLILQLVMNFTNIVLTTWWVLGLGWGIEGAALGTLVAEVVICLLGLWWAWQGWLHLAWSEVKQQLKDKSQWAKLWQANGNIMIRTLLLVGANALLINRSAALGTETLAVNQMLMQLVLFASYFLDGFANVGEVYSGRAVGRKNATALQQVALRTGIYAFVAAGFISLVLWVTGSWWVQFFTVNELLQQQTLVYLPWAVWLPLLAVLAFHLDGLYLGATATTAMRNGMLISFAAYLVAMVICIPLWQNHGLWLAYWGFMLWRGLTLLWQWPTLIQGLVNTNNRKDMG